MNALATTPQDKSLRLASALSNMRTIVESMQTPQDAVNAVANVKTLKDLLEMLNEYDRQISKYMTLEIETYKRIYDLGFSESLRTDTQRRIAKWIGELSEDEHKHLIAECSVSTMALDTYFRNRVRPKQIHDETVSEANFQRSYAMALYRANGVVNLNNAFIGDARISRESKRVFESMKNSTRSDLLKAGAVGVGGSVYVNPETDLGKERIEDYLSIRADSIISDLKKFISFSAQARGLQIGNERIALVNQIVGMFGDEIEKVKAPRSEVV